MLFFAYGLDEEYQIVMSYREVMGDSLFLNMWEPHQTSAFLCSLLMRPYLALAGTTGLVIYLRFCGTILHLLVGWYLCRTFKEYLSGEQRKLLFVIWFATIPKQIMTPEFGMMQVWFFTLLMLFLFRYLKGEGRKYLVLSACSLMLLVLSYPSCLVMYLFVLWVLWHRGKRERRITDLLILTGLCGAGGGAYVLMLLQKQNLSDLLLHVGYLLGGDVTHSVSLAEKLVMAGKHGLLLALLFAGCYALSRVISLLVQRVRDHLWELTFAFAILATLWFWVVLNRGYESMQLHLVVLSIFSLWQMRRLGRQDLLDEICLDGMVGAGICLLAVLYLTDLSLMESIPHAVPAAFFGMIFCMRRANKELVWRILCMWALLALFGKGYTLRAGTEYNNVLETRGILKEGPAAGTLSNYMGAYIYNSDYEDWQNYVEDGDRVLIVVDQVMNLGTTQYLFRDVDISHFSIVNPTAYDQRLLEYWEMFPEKTPNVIVVDCWYGQLMIPEDSWIMQYVEKKFGYTEAVDGRYIRIYRK